MKDTSANNPLGKSFSFLSDLARNNDRDWLNANKPRQKEAQEEFKEFVRELYAGLLTVDPLALSTLLSGNIMAVLILI